MWLEAFTFYVHDIEEQTLQMSFYDYDFLKKDENLGDIFIPLTKLTHTPKHGDVFRRGSSSMSLQKAAFFLSEKKLKLENTNRGEVVICWEWLQISKVSKKKYTPFFNTTRTT